MVLTHTLARNLARVCTRKLSSLYSAAEQMQSEQQGQAPVAGQRTNSGLAPSPLAVNSERCVMYMYCMMLPLIIIGYVQYDT